MVNTPYSQRFQGGDSVQMHKTAESLRDLGVDVVTSTEAEPNANGFDVAHVFNLRSITDTSIQVRSIKRHRVPLVMSPIYVNPSIALWGTTAVTWLFRNLSDPADARHRLSEFAKLRPRVKSVSGQVYSREGQNRPFAEYDHKQRAILSQVCHLLPNSYHEMSTLMCTLGVTDIPFTVVPYAADVEVFENADPQPFVRRYGLRDFLLQVGRIEPLKNQVMLCCAARQLEIPVVLIGATASKSYRDVCERVMPAGSVVIDHLPHEQLASAYAAARVHALPSWFESCGLVTLEAALADCSIVVGNAGYECEYFREYACYCDPSDVDSIGLAMGRAYDKHDSETEGRSALRRIIAQEFTWKRAAEKTLQAYERALSGCITETLV